MANPRDVGYAAFLSNPDPDLREVPGVGLLPRVTAILKTLNSPGLNKWLANQEREQVINAVKRAAAFPQPQTGPGWLRMFWVELKAVREEARQQVSARELGTAVHVWIEWYSRGLMDQERGPEPPILDEIAPAITAWQDWARAVDYRPLLIEQSVYCIEPGCGFCGTIDAVAEVEGVTTLLDWKRASAIYESYIAQAAAYGHALKATEGLVVDRAIVLQLPQTTPAPAVERELLPVELEEAFGIFRGLLAAWRWRRALDERASELRTAVRRRDIPLASPYVAVMA